MLPHGDTDAFTDEPDPADEDGSADSAALEMAAEVICPHCGEAMSIALDPTGGRAQEYVEDCQVCCRPWRVRLWYDTTGAAQVELQPVE
ncbi:MAG TPA: CPXCG motif-containing cysteine-rich protein [Gemmatimonadales bacterium]